MPEGSCTVEERKRIRLVPLTSIGNPAQVDPNFNGGVPRVTVVNGDGSFITDVTDPMLVKLVSGVAEADTVYTIELDKDMSTGEALIPVTFILHVTAAQASTIGVSDEGNEPKV